MDVMKAAFKDFACPFPFPGNKILTFAFLKNLVLFFNRVLVQFCFLYVYKYGVILYIICLFFYVKFQQLKS
jgi:hypothetical protein